MGKRPMILAAATALLATGLALPGTLAVARAASPMRPAAAHERTVTFAVGNMTCALCPVTVKKAMERVAGVRSVAVDFNTRTATVVFDPSLASAAEVAAASTNAGYPARPAKVGN